MINNYYLPCVDLCNKINWLESFKWFLSVDEKLWKVYLAMLYNIKDFCDISADWELTLADTYVEYLENERYVIQQVEHDKSEEISKLIKERDNATKELIHTEKLINEMLDNYPKLKEKHSTYDFLPF